MRKCKNCGAELKATEKHSHEELCPRCGVAPGIETITDLPKANVREAHRKLKNEIKEIKEEKKPEE